MFCHMKDQSKWENGYDYLKLNKTIENMLNSLIGQFSVSVG